MGLRRVVILTLLSLSGLTACGQRGALYIPGKPGDPYFDRQNRGAPQSPSAAPDGNNPGARPVTQPQRDGDTKT